MRSLTPFARAVRTKSSPRTSSRLERVIRAMIASGIVPTAMAGRMRCRTASAKSVQFNVSRAWRTYIREMKSRTTRGGPVIPVRPQRLRERDHGDARREAAGRWQHERGVLEQHGEDECQDETEDEDRDRDTEVGDDHRADVGDGVASHRGRQSEDQPEDDGEEQGHDRQLDGHRQALEQDVGDRPAELDRGPEVAGREGAHVDDELLGDRLVETVLAVERGADRRVGLLAVAWPRTGHPG